MRAWMMLAAPIALAACTGAYEPRPLTDKQASELDKALAGKVPGDKMTCVSREPSTSLQVISNNVVLYRVNRKLVYRNELIGGCSGLAAGDTLILRSFGSQMCRGDFATTANLMTGMQTGACALGDFIPYRVPGK